MYKSGDYEPAKMKGYSMSKIKYWIFEVIVPLVWYTFALPPVNWRWLKIDSIKTRYYSGLTEEEMAQHAGSRISNGDTMKTDIFCNPVLEEKTTVRETGFIVNNKVIRFYTIRSRWRRFTRRFARGISFLLTFWYKIPYNIVLYFTAQYGTQFAKKSLVYYITHYWKNPAERHKFLPRFKLSIDMVFWVAWFCNILVTVAVGNVYIDIIIRITLIFAIFLYVVITWAYYRIAQVVKSKVPAFRESYEETLQSLIEGHRIETELSASLYSCSTDAKYILDIAKTINRSPKTGSLCIYSFGNNCAVITRYTSDLKNKNVYDLHIQDRLVSIKIFEPKYLKLF